MKEIHTGGKMIFAPIDAKDFCGYRTMGYDYMLDGGRTGYANTIEEESILLEAELEYLLGLLALQKRIREKYIPRLEQLEAAEQSDYDKLNEFGNQWRHEHKEELNKVSLLYYT